MTLRSRMSGAVAAFRGNPLENPAVPLSAPAAWMFDFFGGAPTAAGVAINEHTAMQCEAVYSCVNVIASDIAGLPLKVYETTEKGGKRPAVDTDLYYLLAVEPNPEMTATAFLSTWIGCAVLTNNGYAEIQRQGTKAIALWPRNPRHVKMRRATGGEKLENNKLAGKQDLIYEVTDAGVQRLVAGDDMLHLTGLSLDGWMGISPIHCGKQAIGTATAAGKFIGGFFGRGSRPSGILTPTEQMKAGDPRLDQARQSWEKANGGDNQGRTAVMPFGWTWTAIGISPEQMQFLQIGQFTRSQIAGLFRVAPHLIGDTSRLSNGNHESIALEHVTFTLRNWMVRAEAEIQRKLMPKVGRTAGKYSVRFDPTEFIRGDFATMMNGFAVGKQWGFFNTNYIHEQLGLDPIGPDGDVYYVPLNMVPMSQANGTDGTDGGQNNGANDVTPGDGQDAGDGTGDGAGGDAQPAGNGGRNQIRLLQRMGEAYGGLFCDACGRLQSRSKRDAESVAQIVGPVLDAIAAEATRQARTMFRVAPDADLGQEKILRDCRAAILKRSAEWKPGEFDPELQRTVRAITLGIFREAGSTVALAA